MTPIDETRDELTHLLARAERWFDGHGAPTGLAPDDAEISAESIRLRSLRNRALSTQLNVGLLGRQSSGKSFLISGLQGGLEYFRVTDDDDDHFDEYRGILPSSANPTTACPSTVVPVESDASIDTSGRGLLRVRFTNSGWVDIGTNLPPAVVGAYGASDGRVTDRLISEHINNKVEEIELLISDYRLPVKLFDLPGAESVVEDHDLIMRNAWGEADCFIYVSQGTSALTVNELDLIRDLYAHHLQTGKRVLWVLTGIDRATQMEHGQAAWKSVLTTNNDYLRAHFSGAPDTRDTFVGEGFLPVSAAWEAQAAFEDSHGTSGPSLRRRSGMDTLRDTLREVIESGAGRRHLVQVSDEARLLIRRRQRPISDTLAAHRLSIEDLEHEKATVNERLDRVAGAAERLRSQLLAELDRRVRTGQKPFGELAAVLHRGLDELIDSGNLKAEHVSEINVREVQLFAEWMAAPDGPDALWRRQLAELDATARQSLQIVIGDDTTDSQLVSPEPLDIGSFLVLADGRRPTGVYGLVKAAAATMGVASPIVGGVAMAAAGVSLAVVAFPVAAGVGAAIAVAKVVDAVKERESAIQRDRGARKLLIDSQVDKAKSDFAAAATDQGLVLIDAVQAHLDHHRSRLQSTLSQIMVRIQEPDSVTSRELVSRLGPIDRSARDIIAELQNLSDHIRD
jgi:predicted GTPase